MKPDRTLSASQINYTQGRRPAQMKGRAPLRAWRDPLAASAGTLGPVSNPGLHGEQRRELSRCSRRPGPCAGSSVLSAHRAGVSRHGCLCGEPGRGPGPGSGGTETRKSRSHPRAVRSPGNSQTSRRGSPTPGRGTGSLGIFSQLFLLVCLLFLESEPLSPVKDTTHPGTSGE